MSVEKPIIESTATPARRAGETMSYESIFKGANIFPAVSAKACISSPARQATENAPDFYFKEVFSGSVF